jgi:hypothetical protein
LQIIVKIPWRQGRVSENILDSGETVDSRANLKFGVQE